MDQGVDRSVMNEEENLGSSEWLTGVLSSHREHEERLS